MDSKILSTVIYKITNLITNKFYIGSTCDFNKRKYAHLNHLKNNKYYNKKLQNSWNKYGESNFVFEILEHTSRENLIKLEQQYLDFYKPYDKNVGYNIAKLTTTNNFGVKKNTKQIPWNKGLKLSSSWNKGVATSDETKKKQSQAKIGAKHPNFGKQRSEETKNKISLSQKGEKGNNYGKPTNRKKVYQFDLENNLIKEYEFLMDVENYGFNFKKVSAVALGKQKTHKNYKWSYTMNNEQ